MNVSDSLQQSEDRDEATQEDAEESDEDHAQSDFEDPEESDFTPPRFPDPADDEELQSSQASVARDLSSLLHDEDSQPQEKDAVLLESQMSANCLLDIIRSHCEGTLNELFLVKEALEQQEFNDTLVQGISDLATELTDIITEVNIYYNTDVPLPVTTYEKIEGNAKGVCQD